MKADANRKHTKLDNIAFILFVLSLSYLVTACFFVSFKKTIFIYTGSEIENKRIIYCEKTGFRAIHMENDADMFISRRRIITLRDRIFDAWIGSD